MHLKLWDLIHNNKNKLFNMEYGIWQLFIILFVKKLAHNIKSTCLFLYLMPYLCKKE